MKKVKKDMYLVILSACGNVDHFENPYMNIVDGCFVYQGFGISDSIEGCQDIVRKYIDDNNLGAGNWSGGEVFKNGEYIGEISYNRRFWSKDDEDAEEFGHDKCEPGLSIKVKEIFKNMLLKE